MVKPKARNVVSRENNQQYCPHCFNGGGTGNVASNTPGGKWPYPETDQSVSRAGLCGDAAGDDFHLAGGKFYNGGEIQATYNKGGIIDIELGITAHHNGHFEFFLCDKNDLSDPNGPITLECLRKNKLERAFPRALADRKSLRFKLPWALLSRTKMLDAHSKSRLHHSIPIQDAVSSSCRRHVRALRPPVVLGNRKYLPCTWLPQCKLANYPQRVLGEMVVLKDGGHPSSETALQALIPKNFGTALT